MNRPSLMQIWHELALVKRPTAQEWVGAPAPKLTRKQRKKLRKLAKQQHEFLFEPKDNSTTFHPPRSIARLNQLRDKLSPTSYGETPCHPTKSI